MSSSHIRKQVYDLTVEDLNEHGVWEFALDEEGEEGQDEATVRPHQTHGQLDSSEGMFIVRARLKLADGTPLTGYLTPPVQCDSGLGTLQPAAIAGGGQVSFWCGIIEPNPAAIAASYDRLGKSSASEVFPISFESDVPILGGPIAGELPGFVVLEDFRTMRTKVIV